MKWLIFIPLFLWPLLPVRATHIVGGELELKHLVAYSYQVSLNLYFDNIHGDPAAIDPSITLSIFEKGTNARMLDFRMELQSSFRVPYTQIACTSGALSTNKIVYSQNLILSPQIYTSENGYYLVWERCCRNGVIDNIINPGGAGQTFYLEFPAVVRQGRPFYNSSPELFPPVSDYACRNQMFYYDFAGQDPDGDSLAYEMVTPLNGNSTFQVPAPLARPAPYPPVTWTDSLHAANQIPGKPTITIAPQTGRIQVRPTRPGLYVFGIRCSEYRNQVKIGELRRDFQLLVLECPKNGKPGILVKTASQNSYYRQGDTLRLTPADSRCLTLLLTDPDNDEVLTLEAKALNFSLNSSFLTFRSGVVNLNGIRDTLRTTACLESCLDSGNKVFVLDLIVSDDGCSLPMKDTLRLSFQIAPAFNHPPIISTTAGSSIIRPQVGEVIAFAVTGTDADNDEVSLSLTGLNFALTEQAISFPAASGSGSVTSPFTWTINCPAVQQASYLLLFKATTLVCGLPVSDSILIEVQPQYANAPPTIRTNMAGKTIEIPFGTLFSDSIYAADADGHLIHIQASGEGFNLADYGMQCPPASGRGAAATRFSWQPNCQVGNKQEFPLSFAVLEEACRPEAPPPLKVTFRVLPEAASTIFMPANIFTPNNDGLNDYFEIPNLPPDLCQSLFTDIRIYNRWGGQVFESKDRHFKWSGTQVADGVYYYVITYTDKRFRGTITKVR